MATAAELVVATELADLHEVAAVLGLSVISLSSRSFLVGLKAAEGSGFWVVCDADGYPGTPPAWRWCNAEGLEADALHLCPRSGASAFFHDNGVICAPWNRLAYNSVDPRGPHGDWTIGNWQANSYTGECKTLAAMVMRIEIELQARFTGRVREAA